MWDHKLAVFDWLLPISVGVTVVGVGSFIYHLFKDEDDNNINTGRIYTANSTSVEIRVPRFSVGSVVGRQGHKIREIQVLSETRMFFKETEEEDEQKICVIRGLPQNVERAQKCVYDLILYYPLMNTVEIFIPTRTCCSLVSKYGENIRWVRRATHCKVILDNWCFHNNFSTRKIFIKGSDDQIERAKNFLARKVEEDTRPPATPSGVLPVPCRRRSVSLETEIGENFTLDMNEVFATGNNGLLEVFVASIESPEKFWVQIMGPGILSSIKLTEDMTNFYEKPSARRKYALKDVSVGELIAVPFQYDSKWYRGEVLKIHPDETNDKDTSLEVFYIDHGDVGNYRKREVFKLKEEFLELRHQAIRCLLANVEPRGGVWSEESIDFFRELTIIGLWKTISAKVVDYRALPEPNYKKDSSVACLQLIDTTHEAYVDVASELVDKGYALWLDDNQAKNAIP